MRPIDGWTAPTTPAAPAPTVPGRTTPTAWPPDGPEQPAPSCPARLPHAALLKDLEPRLVTGAAPALAQRQAVEILRVALGLLSRNSLPR
eukprot:15136422-Alexandrium_andersonii.AAC.1